jgi:hypothetical protein
MSFAKRLLGSNVAKRRETSYAVLVGSKDFWSEASGRNDGGLVMSTGAKRRETSYAVSTGTKISPFGRNDSYPRQQ